MKAALNFPFISFEELPPRFQHLAPMILSLPGYSLLDTSLIGIDVLHGAGLTLGGGPVDQKAQLQHHPGL